MLTDQILRAFAVMASLAVLTGGPATRSARSVLASDPELRVSSPKPEPRAKAHRLAPRPKPVKVEPDASVPAPVPEPARDGPDVPRATDGAERPHRRDAEAGAWVLGEHDDLRHCGGCGAPDGRERPGAGEARRGIGVAERPLGERPGAAA